MKPDVVAIVEAAYALEPDADAWFGAVVDCAAPVLDRGQGVLAWQYDVSVPAQLRVWSPRFARGSAEQSMRMIAGLTGASAEMSPEQNRRAYLESGPVKTVSAMFGAVPRGEPGFGHHVASMGAHDFLVVLSQDPSRSGCALVAPLPEVRQASPSDRRLWTRVAAHVAAGLRLRQGSRNETDGTAVLTPGGRVEHATGAAQPKNARDALREAARRIDRARSRARHESDEALNLWQGLVAGRWSLVDRFDTDGRRYLIARENAPDAPDPRALTARERQVLAYTAFGHPLKLAAYELGLSISSVGRYRASAMRKLGLRSHADIGRLFALETAEGGDVVAREPPMSSPGGHRSRR